MGCEYNTCVCGSNRWSMLNLKNSESVQSIPRTQNYTDMLTQEACIAPLFHVCVPVCVCTCMSRPGHGELYCFPYHSPPYVGTGPLIKPALLLGLVWPRLLRICLSLITFLEKQVTLYTFSRRLYMLYCLRDFYDGSVPELLKGK